MNIIIIIFLTALNLTVYGQKKIPGVYYLVNNYRVNNLLSKYFGYSPSNLINGIAFEISSDSTYKFLSWQDSTNYQYCEGQWKYNKKSLLLYPDTLRFKNYSKDFNFNKYQKIRYGFVFKEQKKDQRIYVFSRYSKLKNIPFETLVEKVTRKDETFEKERREPKFKGDYQDFLSKNIIYPSNALNNNIEGQVIIEYRLNKDASISSITIIKGIGYGCDEEAMRVVKAMEGLWIPGRFKGRNVNYKTQIPINFILNSKK